MNYSMKFYVLDLVVFFPERALLHDFTSYVIHTGF